VVALGEFRHARGRLAEIEHVGERTLKAPSRL
jgi:hypothetical protein